MLIEQEQAKVDRARAQFEAAKDRLYRPDGQPVYGPEEHQERLDSLLEQHFNAVARPIHDAAAAEEERAKAAVVASERDPIFTAKAEDAAKAGSLLPFLSSAPIDQLAAQAKAAIAAGDRAAQLAIHHVLKSKYDALSEEFRRNGGRADSRSASEAVPINEALDSLNAVLKDPKADERRSQSQQAIKATRELQMYVNRTYTELSGALDRQMADMRRNRAI